MQDIKELREIYCDSLLEMAATNKDIVVVEADLTNCIKTGRFKAAYPDRFINVGIAEANMIGVCAGLSTCGKIPFCSSFAPFATRRCYDQIFISVAYSKQNVKIVGTDPGITAELNGGTHMPFEDMGIMRNIPNMVCIEPTDAAMLKSLMPQIASYYGPVYLRIMRKKCEQIYGDGAEFDMFKAFTLRQGADVTIIASGIMVSRALEAADKLKSEGVYAEVINVYTWKPIDEETIVKSVSKTKACVVAENHNVHNGLFGAVTEVLAQHCPVPAESVSVKDLFGEVGKIPYLEEKFALRSNDIYDAAKKVISRK